ncbi:hypothetical protein NliqN6_0397 [Naganishia liquefaciens]|uniref:Acyl-protein thioesterase 1 n=1 Tax=Naganishia liquefaciens TaxID=104408 RepID=A0A8H3YC76_9TREE|nr:hypothetical protein NliqN6_0397 [Naganishia liquefaciens]
MQSVKIVEAVTKQTGTVIFLHGLGDAGTSFVPFAKVLQQQHPHLRFVFPTAQTLPITLNSGYPMPAWFDIKALDKLTNSIHDDETGMMRSVAAVESLIEKEVKERGIKEDRIVIGGFSQGCVISVLTALRTQRNVAGVISLSGWLPLSHKIEELTSPGAKNLAVFWGHGKQDAVVNYKYGQQSCELLQSLKSVNLPNVPKGTPFAKPGIRFESYDGMGHSLDEKEIRDLSEWLKHAVPA